MLSIRKELAKNKKTNNFEKRENIIDKKLTHLPPIETGGLL
jgi:hypothetical protein